MTPEHVYVILTACGLGDELREALDRLTVHDLADVAVTYGETVGDMFIAWRELRAAVTE